VNILWLGDPACGDRVLAGGKAATLSVLAARYRVPPGFCLSTAAFDQASASGLCRRDAAAPAQTVAAALCDELATAYQMLAERCSVASPGVAVRSSAVDEDGRLASFAGQHETYLNVAGVEAVAEAVVHCWASALAPRALAYRQAQGLTTACGQMAVLVQHLVPADVSAIVFSANPLTGSRDEAVITASWGLGESIVGGSVTPDTYVTRKAGPALLFRQIAAKARMTVLVPGSTREVDVPRFLRRQPALTDAQVGEMAQLAVALEETMGWPVDLECAYHDGALYLLQCRPITTLPSPERVPGAER
jgi:pyruvate,water dikinase